MQGKRFQPRKAEQRDGMQLKSPRARGDCQQNPESFRSSRRSRLTRGKDVRRGHPSHITPNAKRNLVWRCSTARQPNQAACPIRSACLAARRSLPHRVPSSARQMSASKAHRRRWRRWTFRLFFCFFFATRALPRTQNRSKDGITNKIAARMELRTKLPK